MGFLLLVPFFLIRFGLLSLLEPAAIRRAAHFAPMEPRVKAAYWLYQLSTAAIVVGLCCLKIKTVPHSMFFTGIVIYGVGNALLIFSMLSFAYPSASGINLKGLYRVSRNPMYVAYFVYFLGCVLVTQSLILLAAVLLFQISAHWIILAEEQWCLSHFGSEYEAYRKKVRRYF